MKNKILFLIVVHNKSIIDLFESAKKYHKLTNYKYLLVGNHNTDHSNDIIIQFNKLEKNIEHNANYLAYTGWYAAAHNKEITNGYDYVCLLEYDTDINENFSITEFCNEVVSKNKKCYGITAMDSITELFARNHFSDKLIDFLIKNKITEIKTTQNRWITTNNVVFTTEFLDTYFNHYLTKEILIYFNNHKMSGHFLERYLSIFCFLYSVDFDIIKCNNMQHRGYDSHRTQNIFSSHRGYEQFKTTNKVSN